VSGELTTRREPIESYYPPPEFDVEAIGSQQRNLKRLLRSLIKLRGERSQDDVEKDYARLRRAYDLAWNRGY
jgi:hypothetical protein